MNFTADESGFIAGMKAARKAVERFMSRTHKGSKGPGFDFNSRRCNGNKCADYGPFAKHKTHRRERHTEAKKAIKESCQ